MPLFGYFAVVTPCLVAPLFIVAATFDAKTLQMDITAPVRLSGYRVPATISLPILTVREAPPPPAWAVSSIEDQAMAQQSVRMKQPPAKIAGGQSKKSKRQVQAQRAGKRHIAAAVPSAYEAIGRVW